MRINIARCVYFSVWLMKTEPNKTKHYRSSRTFAYKMCSTEKCDSYCGACVDDGWLKQPHLNSLIGLWGRVRLHTRCTLSNQLNQPSPKLLIDGMDHFTLSGALCWASNDQERTQECFSRTYWQPAAAMGSNHPVPALSTTTKW
jgi:hypothetical protein